MRLAARVPCTEVEGPHRRFAIWVQGCSLRCPGCCNPELFTVRSGQSVNLATLAAELEQARADYAIEGVTIVGGEPLEQIADVREFASMAQRLQLGVLLFSGYTWEQAGRLQGFEALWNSVDTLVCGPFDPSLAEPIGGRRFIGSSNQVLRHRTERYASPALWRGTNAAEVHIEKDGQVCVVGFPTEVKVLLRQLRIPATARG